jgi:hypothetical protein
VVLATTSVSPPTCSGSCFGSATPASADTGGSYGVVGRAVCHCEPLSPTSRRTTTYVAPAAAATTAMVRNQLRFFGAGGGTTTASALHQGLAAVGRGAHQRPRRGRGGRGSGPHRREVVAGHLVAGAGEGVLRRVQRGPGSLVGPGSHLLGVGTDRLRGLLHVGRDRVGGLLGVRRDGVGGLLGEGRDGVRGLLGVGRHRVHRLLGEGAGQLGGDVRQSDGPLGSGLREGGDLLGGLLREGDDALDERGDQLFRGGGDLVAHDLAGVRGLVHRVSPPKGRPASTSHHKP